MNASHHHRADTLLAIGCIVLVVGAAVYFFSYITADPDLWGHILFGRDNLANGGVQRTDPYSFTAHGLPWVNHEWLAEVLFYGIWHRIGDAGLLYGKLLVGGGVLWALWILTAMRTGKPLLRAAVLVMAVTCISPGFMIRPQLFSFLLFAWTVVIVHRYMISGKNRLWILPALMALWVNMHGGFLMGVAYIGAIVVWEILEHLFGKRSPEPVLRLLGWSTVAAAAALLNPYGLGLLKFLAYTLSSPRDISEWNALPILELSYTTPKLMMVLVIGCLVMGRRYVRGWEAAGVLVTMVAAGMHQRHLPFFGICAAPFLCAHLSRLIDARWRTIGRVHFGRFARLSLAAAAVLVGGYLLGAGGERYILSGSRIVVDPGLYPIGAVSFMKKNGIHGNIIVPFDWGEYVTWKLGPESRVSIDGRFRTVYPEAVIQDHFFDTADTMGWKRLLDKYPADIILTERRPALKPFLTGTGEWVYIYSDPMAMIFVRNQERHADVLDRFYRTGLIYTGLDTGIYFP